MEAEIKRTWKPDCQLERVLDVAKALAVCDGRGIITAEDIVQAIDGEIGAAAAGLVRSACPQRVKLDETARALLQANSGDGTVTLAEVRSRLFRLQSSRPQPFDTVEDWLMAELGAWRFMAAAAEVQYGSTAFCPPGERRAETGRGWRMRAQAEEELQRIGLRLAETEWHPRRNPLVQLRAEHDLSRLSAKCLLLLYLHKEFGIWTPGGGPARIENLARTAACTVGETDLVERAVQELEGHGLVVVDRGLLDSALVAVRAVSTEAFWAAAAADCPKEILATRSPGLLDDMHY